ELLAELQLLRARVADLERRKTPDSSVEPDDPIQEARYPPEKDNGFKFLFDQSTDVIFIENENGLIVDANISFAERIGYSREEAMGMDAALVWANPADRSGWKEEMARSARVVDQRWKVRRKDGSLGAYLLSSAVQRPADGSKAYLTICRDVTDEKPAEQALKRSEARYRDLFENAIDAMYTETLFGDFTSANKAAERLIGVDRAQLLSMNLREIVAPEHLAEMMTSMDKRIQDGIDHSKPKEIRIRRPDGEERWVEVVCRIVREEERPVEIQCTARDVTDRRLAQQALRQSEEKFRDLVELLPQPVFEVDTSGILTFANSKGLEDFGYRREDLDGGIYVGELIAPEGRPRALNYLRRVLSGEITGGREFEALRKDGTTFPALVHAIPIKHGEEAVGVRGVMVDLSAHKQAEEALRESESRLRTAWETSPDGFSISRLADAVYVDVNQGFSELTGYGREEVIGKSALDLALWPDPSDRLPLVAGLKKNGYVKNLETKLRRRDGNLKTVLVSAGLMMLHGEPHLLALTKDIEELKQAQEAVTRSEEIFRNCFELGLVGMALISPDMHWAYTNNHICRMLGYSREDLHQTKWWDLTHTEDLESDLGQFNRLLEGRIDGYVLDKRFIRKDGSVVHTTCHVGCIRRPDGRIEHIVAHVQDITDRKHLEEQLLHAGKMEAIGQLAGGLAHDFNNILTAILGYCSLLTHELPRYDPASDKIRQIKLAARKAADLTRQLLAFSRKQVLDVKTTYLNEIVSDTGDLLRRLISEDVDLEIVLDPLAGPVQADQVQVQQILMNLVVNARDAMPQGGKLTIETANALLDEAYARMHPEVRPGKYVMIAVSDSGRGMDPHVLSRIFEPFFTTKAKGLGTGLGLSTVYGIVKQHQGHIAVYSEPGHGTTFKVYFPHTEVLPIEESRLGEMGPGPSGRETILVVEDEESVRKLVCEALKTLGYRTLSASDPGEAMEICRYHDDPIELLLTDVVLPGIDGRTLYNTLTAGRSDLKVLYVSGYTENFIVHHGVLEKGVHFLHKPFDVDSLARMVRKVIDEV
ncbi:MAG: PAS domain S-box protein, partial [Pseudomonadota bacterium]